MSDAIVLDSSALLCLLNAEPGADRVAGFLADAAIGSVNLAEVVGKLREHGLSVEEVREMLGSLSLDIRPFTLDHAYLAGELRPRTRDLGLSLGDRACLALALALGRPALTADRRWLELDIGVEMVPVR